MKARKTALLGILCAQAIALSFLENLIPSLPFLPPGAKPGFSNIVTMFTVLTLGLPQAMCITVFKALFALMTRGATAFFYEPRGRSAQHPRDVGGNKNKIRSLRSARRVDNRRRMP